MRVFPQVEAGHSRLGSIVAELREMSATYRRRLDVVTAFAGFAVLTQGLNVLAFYLVDRMLFPAMTTTLGQHFLVVPLILFSTAVPLPFGCWASAGSQRSALQISGARRRTLALLGFRVLMYAGGLIGACVYLANLNEVRGLMHAAEVLEDDPPEGQPGGEDPEHGENSYNVRRSPDAGARNGGRAKEIDRVRLGRPVVSTGGYLAGQIAGPLDKLDRGRHSPRGFDRRQRRRTKMGFTLAAQGEAASDDASLREGDLAADLLRTTSRAGLDRRDCGRVSFHRNEE